MPLTFASILVYLCLNLKQKTPAATASSNINRTVTETATVTVGKLEPAGFGLKGAVLGDDSMSVKQVKHFCKDTIFWLRL